MRNWICAYDGNKDKLPDGRCAVCGKYEMEAQKAAREWDKAVSTYE